MLTKEIIDNTLRNFSNNCFDLNELDFELSDELYLDVIEYLTDLRYITGLKVTRGVHGDCYISRCNARLLKAGIDYLNSLN